MVKNIIFNKVIYTPKKTPLSGDNVKKKNIFFICPTRDCPREKLENIGRYVRSLEQAGHSVHWPYHDTHPGNPVGIYVNNKTGMIIAQCDEIHIWHFKRGAQSSLFDFLMLHGLNKKVVLANLGEVKKTPHGSFENILLYWHENGAKFPAELLR